MTAPELKPCPFCGGEASLITGDECAYVQCLDVKMHRGPFIDGDNDAVSEAAAAWNRRADLAAAIEPQPDPRTADYEQAYQYALTLADALIAKHYPDNKDWRPLGDLTGLLTQIDNMVAGKKPDPRDAVIARLVEAAQVCVNTFITSTEHSNLRAAIAAAKAVQP